MLDKTFVDTNILIYAHDVDAGDKHGIAKRVLAELWEGHAGVLSPQVLHEFYVNITRKVSQPLTRQLARRIVRAYEPWCIETTSAQIETAFRIEDESGISYWDALICASAVQARATRIFTEDLNHGQRIAGVLVQNPFVQ